MTVEYEIDALTRDVNKLNQSLRMVKDRLSVLEKVAEPKSDVMEPLVAEHIPYDTSAFEHISRQIHELAVMMKGK